METFAERGCFGVKSSVIPVGSSLFGCTALEQKIVVCPNVYRR